jgi:TolB protein
MTVSAPPRPPSPERAATDGAPLTRDEIEALVEALIDEARRETRRRHRTYWAVAALATFVGVVVLILLDGGAASQIASPALSARSSLVAGAASSKIAFISEPPVGGYCGVVYVMNADGSGQRRLVSSTESCGQEAGPAWSPDGRRIAIVSNGMPGGIPPFGESKIYVLNADGTGLRRLTRSSGFEHSPAWSPDGRTIAFFSGRDGNAEIYVVNTDGRGERLLTRAAVDFGQLAWSPNGQKLAFTSALTSGPGGNVEVYVVNADGSGQRRLTRRTVRDSDPVWSPDARRIVFESNWQLWVMNADGSGQRRLTQSGGRNFNAEWSPDGQRIAFERGRRPRYPCSACPGARGYEVYVTNADGSGQQRLARRASQPHWSPDGRKIAFVSKRDGDPDIYVMNADGSGQRNLTQGAGRRESQPVWSPAHKK